MYPAVRFDVRFIVAIFTLFMVLAKATPLFAVYADNPGGDQPDESYKLGDAIFPAILEGVKPNIDIKSRAAILDNGYSRGTILFTGLYLPVRIVTEIEFPDHASSITLLIIPSGGLSYLKDQDGFTNALNKFVEGGGILLVFAQRLGSEYSILPHSQRQHLQGYGWLEDQSSLANSAILSMRHPTVSRLTKNRPHLNADGFFSSYPDNSKPVLRNSISGQPVMLIYRHGNGSVIASSLFTDWAYLHNRATWDEVALLSGVLRWAGLSLMPSAPQAPVIDRKTPLSPVLLPEIGLSVQSGDEIYMAGETATFTINMWNNGNRKRIINVYYDGMGHDVELLPRGFSRLTYSIPVYSTRRLWVYFYDEDKIFLHTLKKGYVVVYPTSIDGD